MEAGDVLMMHIADAPYIQNYIGTGEEYPGPYSPELERLEERLEMLQNEREDIKALECLPEEDKADLLKFYDCKIEACLSEIENREGKHA